MQGRTKKEWSNYITETETARLVELKPVGNGGRCIKMAAAIYVRMNVTNAR